MVTTQSKLEQTDYLTGNIQITKCQKKKTVCMQKTYQNLFKYGAFNDDIN